MDESIKASGAETAYRLSRDSRDSRKSADRSRHSSDKERELDRHEAVARTDELAWRGYFCDQQRGMFYLFRDIEMYEAYVRETAKSVDNAVATEREDRRMRQRWEALRQAFNLAVEKVVVQRADESKSDAVSEKKWMPTLPFRAVAVDAAEGNNIKVARVFVKIEPLLPRKRSSRRAVLRAREQAEADGAEQAWHLHKIHWLRINRKQRSTKHDTLDILEEAA